MSGTPAQGATRQKHSIVGWVLLAASLALFGLAAFHLVRMISRGYDYTCTGGDGRPLKSLENSCLAAERRSRRSGNGLAGRRFGIVRAVGLAAAFS